MNTPDLDNNAATAPASSGRSLSTVRSLARLIPYARPAIPAMVFSTLAAAVATVCGLVFPLVIGAIIDGPIRHGDAGGLIWPGIGLLALGLAEAGLFFVRRIIIARPAMRVEARMRTDLYDKLQRLPVAFHDRWSAGQLLSRAVSDLGMIRRFLSFVGVFIVVNVTTFVIGTVILIILDWRLGLIMALLAIPLVGIAFPFETRYRVLSRVAQDQVGDLATTVEESVLGIRILKAFGRGRHLSRQFRLQAVDLRDMQLRKARVLSILWAVIIALPEIAVGVILLLGIQQVVDGSLTAGLLVSFFGVAMTLRWPLESLGWLMAIANETAAATERFYEVMDEPETLNSPPSPQQAGDRLGHLRFADVHFAFPDATDPGDVVLRGFDLELRPGETVALVGATGSGKSAVTMLVNRLHDVTGGAVLLNGVDVRDLELRDLRRRIGVAFEEPTLFSASVRENILMGLNAGDGAAGYGGVPDADAAVARAISIAQADFVYDLPWGWDTRIGEQGLALSGGQRQRLALARAVVGQPEVLVLDDPLSALDIHTEAAVEQALRSVLADTTALIVAHRASTVQLADRVALLVDGAVAALGTHSELMATVPAYADLLSSTGADTGAGAGPDDAPVRGEAPVRERPSPAAGPLTDQPEPARPADPARSADLDDPDREWRGVASEDVDEVSSVAGAKLARRSRVLLASLLKPHRRRLVTLGVLTLFEQASFMLGPLLVGYGIDAGIPGLVRGDGWPATLAVSGYLLAGIVNAFSRAAFVRLTATISQAMLLDVRSRVFDHSQSLSVSFHEHYTSGRVISRLTSDLDSLQDLAEEGLDSLISGVLSVVIISATLVFLDPTLGLIVLLSYVPIWWRTRWFQRVSRVIYRRTRRVIATLIVQFTETMNGLRAVLAFRREPRNSAIFSRMNHDFAVANGDGYIAIAKYSPSIHLIGNITLTAVMVVGAARVIDGDLMIGVLASFMLYLRRMYDPLEELAMFYNGFQSASAALEKISGLLEEEPTVREPEHPIPVTQIRGDVALHGVEFSYTPGTPVLHTIDLTIPAGQTVALVGTTGAGKSTLAKLVARFYDPTSGQVTVDGVDIAALSTDDLRRGVVMVTQESFLFSGPVADNIALGKPTATRTDIEAAADAIGAGGFIRQLPNGFDTDVRKRGGRLSAGQRQLVAFARAFLADPAVLILDEATASLDIPSERSVQQALRTVLRGRTAIIIAHRLSTVEIADRVLVMADGRVIEDGSPTELMASAGAFATLHTAWRESLV